MTPSEQAQLVREIARLEESYKLGPHIPDRVAALRACADALDQLSAPGVLVTTREKAEDALEEAHAAGALVARANMAEAVSDAQYQRGLAFDSWRQARRTLGLEEDR